KICVCLTAKTIARNLDILEQYRKSADMAELRVDCLDPDERLLIRRFPELAGLPSILTIRRKIDGGRFISGEGSRASLMARGLAYADIDRRKNFAYIDLEEDLRVPSIEEAARSFGTRVIRSYHNFKGDDEDLAAKMRAMTHAGDEILKVAVMANSTWDALALLRAGREHKGREKVLVAMGEKGIFSRILAKRFGSLWSYALPSELMDADGARLGIMDPAVLARDYRFRQIGADTKIYGAAGFPLRAAHLCGFFNAVFEMESMDAVYAPFPADSIVACMELARELGLLGLSVFSPYKESVIPLLDEQSPDVEKIGACSALERMESPEGATMWRGHNFEGLAFRESISEFLGWRSLRRTRATVIGSGSAAKAVAAELYRAGAKALILDGAVRKARALALPYRFAWGSLDEVAKIEEYRDIIIRAVSDGAEDRDFFDSAERHAFTGQEIVMDLACRPETTAFLKRASEAGCKVLGGRDALARQARLQYACFTGREFPEYAAPKIQMEWD
ncbi:MAG: type I 3-dehydroquinate dehydratase, partial [Treponema sp.]|nr:type I 3-dehydroquinate dehydratase [Treponema sp.]